MFELLDLNGRCDSVSLPTQVAGSPISSGRSSPLQSTVGPVARRKRGRPPTFPPPAPMRKENTVLSALRESFAKSTHQHSPPLSQETGGPISLPSSSSFGLGASPRGESFALAEGSSTALLGHLDRSSGDMRSGARSPIVALGSQSSIVLGRHTLLPNECRLHHAAISRHHLKIDCVGLPEEKPAPRSRATKPKNQPRLEGGFTAPQEPTPYTMTSLGLNDVFVNGKPLVRGETVRLNVHDTISFLEDAFDPDAGIFEPDTSAKQGGPDKPQPTKLAELLHQRHLLPTRRAVDEEKPNLDFSPLQRSASKRNNHPLPVFMVMRRGRSPTVGTRAEPKRQVVRGGSVSTSSNSSRISTERAKKAPAKKKGRHN